MSVPPRYAVLLKAHYWDDGVRDRLDELRRAAPRAEIFLFLDETRGPITVPDVAIKTIRKTERDAERIGLLPASILSLFWYNTDYPLYLSAAELAAFDYVIMTEHDVAVRIDLDEMVGRAAEQATHFVADPIRGYDANWFWLPTINGVYGIAEIRPVLTCFCLIARSALRHLFARRTLLSEQYRRGVLQQRRTPMQVPHPHGLVESWPFSEAFMATELASHSFRVEPLSHYGGTGNYDWWPPKLDRNLPAGMGAGVFHPVLSETRYVISIIRSEPNLSGWFDPDSKLRCLLAGCDRDLVVARIGQEMSARGDAEGLRRLQSLTAGEADRFPVVTPLQGE